MNGIEIRVLAATTALRAFARTRHVAEADQDAMTAFAKRCAANPATRTFPVPSAIREL